MRGPGRFMVFSTGAEREPYMSVYPDSGKVSVPEGILLASSAVDYWHGEGTWKTRRPLPRRTPASRRTTRSRRSSTSIRWMR